MQDGLLGYVMLLADIIIIIFGSVCIYYDVIGMGLLLIIPSSSILILHLGQEFLAKKRSLSLNTENLMK